MQPSIGGFFREKQGSRGACLPTRGHEAETALDPEQELVRLVLTSPCDVRSGGTLVPLLRRLGTRHGCSGVVLTLPGWGKVSRGGSMRLSLRACLLVPGKGGQHVAEEEVSGSGGHTRAQPHQEAETRCCPEDEPGEAGGVRAVVPTAHACAVGRWAEGSLGCARQSSRASALLSDAFPP